MTAPLLDVQSLCCQYPQATAPALRDVSFALAPGEMLVLAGASGAGKSTCCHCLGRVIPAFTPADLRGRILLHGESIAGAQVQELVPRVGMVFQDFETQLFSTQVFQEVAFGLENLGIPREEMLPRIERTLVQVGLAGLATRNPATLSGGQKQRLVIAAVTALYPSLLVMDEPTTDLDPAGRDDVLALASALRHAGAGVVIVDHDLEELAAADHVVVLRDGVVALCLPMRQALQRPAECAALGLRPAPVADFFVRLGVSDPPVTVEEGIAYLREQQWQLAKSFPPATAPRGEALLEARALSYQYPDGEQAVRQATLTIRQGEVVAILGSNGSGKTTLCKLLCGLLTPGEGEISFRGVPLRGSELARMARHVGYVFQNPDQQLFATTVREEVEFGPRNFGVPSEELPARVAQALAAVHLGGQEACNPFIMARGERQRVAVASILSAAPEILILDEPTTGLDYAQQREMLAMLMVLRQAGHTIILVTHTMWLAAEYADRGILMADGAIIADGSIRELFADTAQLARAGVKPPSITALGVAFGCPALTVDELVDRVER